jgi:hypothetical protein
MIKSTSPLPSGMFILVVPAVLHLVEISVQKSVQKFFFYLFHLHPGLILMIMKKEGKGKGRKK